MQVNSKKSHNDDNSNDVDYYNVLDVNKGYVRKLAWKMVANFCVWVVAGLWSFKLQKGFICGGNFCRRIPEVLEQLGWKDKRDICWDWIECLGYEGFVCSN